MKPALNVEGFTPLKDDSYKLLVNNVFSMPELGLMASALANNLAYMNKTNLKTLEEPKHFCACALGKILLAMPEEYRKPLLETFKTQLGLEFHLQEIQTTDVKH